jgi:hypothetical protein
MRNKMLLKKILKNHTKGLKKVTREKLKEEYFGI